MITPQYPKPDSEREERIIGDVMGLLKLRSSLVVSGSDTIDPKEQVRRWLKHTLNKAKRSSRLPWWFARRSFIFTIYPGQDVFDFKGDIDRILSVISHEKLQRKSMEWIAQRRSESHGRSNSGIPEFYCDFGGRLHLYPAPHKEMLLSVFYTLPLTCDIVPDDWETALLDGVIGLYGRHFDKSGMVDDPSVFESRFWRALEDTQQNNHDADLIYRKQPKGNTVAQMYTLSQALAEANAGNPGDDAILTPAYQEQLGSIQILGDDPSDNTHSTPFAQIPGDLQP